MDLIFDDLHFAYFEEGRDTIGGLSAVFRQEEITLLTGVSGCGKSTLLYLAAGLYPHHAGNLRSGTVRIGGADPASLPASERCRKIGMMFQNPDLQFCMDTVWNELIFCLENIRTKEADFRPRAEEALAFAGITHLKDRRLNSLSGGEKQKAALACLVALRPEWLLLDEPFANIDTDASAQVLEKLVEMHETFGTGILAVDHRLEQWLSAADRICIMKDGLLTGEEFRPEPGAGFSAEDQERLYEAGIAVPGHSYLENAPEEKNSADDSEHIVETAGTPKKPGNDSPVLSIRHLTVSHPGSSRRDRVRILDDLKADFLPGRVYAIIGRSGSGKSTFFGALSGLYEYSGEILLEGEDLKKVRKKAAGKIGFVTQSPQDQFIGGTVRNEIQAVFGKDPEADKKSEEILRDIKLWRYRDISPYMLSQGQQRRLGVAALMAYPCRVLVCDEPTYAQDRNNTRTIMERLISDAKERNITVIFSTHDLQLARDYAEHIYRLEGGCFMEVMSVPGDLSRENIGREPEGRDDR